MPFVCAQLRCRAHSPSPKLLESFDFFRWLHRTFRICSTLVFYFIFMWVRIGHKQPLLRRKREKQLHLVFHLFIFLLVWTCLNTLARNRLGGVKNATRYSSEWRFCLSFFVLVIQAGDVEGLNAAVLAGSAAFNQVRHRVEHAIFYLRTRIATRLLRQDIPSCRAGWYEIREVLFAYFFAGHCVGHP